MAGDGSRRLAGPPTARHTPLPLPPNCAAPRPPSRPGPHGAVPLAYVVLSWEPTDLAALALRAVVAAKEALYWALIVAFPCGGWLLLFPVLISLRFSRCGVRRGGRGGGQGPAEGLL